MSNNDVTLTAQWTPTEYSITFTANSGSFYSSYTKTAKYTIESSAITLPTSSNITSTSVPIMETYMIRIVKHLRNMHTKDILQLL